jgi:DNA-binding PadR family transcriptional regulator
MEVKDVLTPLAMAVLALLVERPMHPYEMFRTMTDRHEEDLVKVRPGTLYHAVGRLVESGLVEAVGTDREGGRPERTTYRVTDAGRAALQQRLRTLLAEPVNEYPSFPLALGEAHNLPADEVRELLAARIKTLEETILETGELLARTTAKGVDEAFILDRHYLLHMITAQRDWLRTLAGRMENEELAWPPRTT